MRWMMSARISTSARRPSGRTSPAAPVSTPTCSSRNEAPAPSKPRRCASTCVVREQCLDYAIANGEHFGIWGGMSERERQQIRTGRRRRQTVLAPPSATKDDWRIDNPVTPELDDVDQADDVVASTAVDASPTDDVVRACVICDAPLPASRLRTCGPEHAAEHKRRQKAGYRANGNGKHEVVSDVPLSGTTSIVAGQPEPVAVLAAAGFQVRSVELELAWRSMGLDQSERSITVTTTNIDTPERQGRASPPPGRRTVSGRTTT